MIGRKYLRIFIVDDDAVWTKLLRDRLTRMHYTDVSCFTSGEECLRKIAKFPDLIFLDYQMSNQNGIEILKKTKQFCQDICVVFTSSQEDIRVAIDALQLGAMDYLIKTDLNSKTLEDIFEKIENSDQGDE